MLVYGFEADLANMLGNASYTRRWYDKHPLTSSAMTILQEFPKEIQTIIAHGVIELTNSEFKVNELLRSYKNLGRDKVMQLYLAQRKQRKMDGNPYLYRAMSHMTVLSRESQVYTAQKILELMKLVIDYMKTCKQFEVEAQEDDVLNLTNTYLTEGGDEARSFLMQLESNFQQHIQDRMKKVMNRAQGNSLKVDLNKNSGEFRIRDTDL